MGREREGEREYELYVRIDRLCSCTYVEITLLPSADAREMESIVISRRRRNCMSINVQF